MVSLSRFTNMGVARGGCVMTTRRCQKQLLCMKARVQPGSPARAREPSVGSNLPTACRDAGLSSRNSRPADQDMLVLIRRRIGAHTSIRDPTHRAVHGEGAQTVDYGGFWQPVFGVRHIRVGVRRPDFDEDIEAGRRGFHAPR